MPVSSPAAPIHFDRYERDERNETNVMNAFECLLAALGVLVVLALSAMVIVVGGTRKKTPPIPKPGFEPFADPLGGIDWSKLDKIRVGDYLTLNGVRWRVKRRTNEGLRVFRLGGFPNGRAPGTPRHVERMDVGWLEVFDAMTNGTAKLSHSGRRRARPSKAERPDRTERRGARRSRSRRRGRGNRGAAGMAVAK